MKRESGSPSRQKVNDSTSGSTPEPSPNLELQFLHFTKRKDWQLSHILNHAKTASPNSRKEMMRRVAGFMPVILRYGAEETSVSQRNGWTE